VEGIDMSRISAVRDIPIRRARRDGLPMWPDRAIGRDPGINAAEVERALSRPPHSKCTAPSRSLRTGLWPVNLGEPPMRDGKKLTYTQAAAMRGISAAAMFKRVQRYGWSEAMKMTVRGAQ
jgi:hypothetical protein